MNYFTDVYNIRNPKPYDIYYDIDRSLINAKLKASKKNECDNLVMGASVTQTLFDSFESLKISRFILSAISYKEYYEILQIFFNIHKEAKTIFLPLEYHTILFDDEVYEYDEKFDYKENLSYKEIIRVYFSFEATKKSIEYWIEKAKGEPKEVEVRLDGYDLISVPEMKLTPNIKLSESKIESDYYYWGKIIDFLQERNIKIYCFIPPVNYIYLQDALTPEKVEVVNNLKKLVTSKGVKIHDFTKKNQYNQQRLDESCLFFDVIHPNFLYGNIVYKNLTNQKSDTMWYRIITKDNVDECNRLSVKELDEYRKTHKDYIKEYYMYGTVEWNSPKNRRIIHYEEIPDFIKYY